MKSRTRAANFAWLMGAALVASTPPSNAQDPLAGASTVDSLRILQSILMGKKVERARLERMLDGLNVVDSAYKHSYPSWVVLDEDLRERILRVFRMHHQDVSREDPITVVANPAGREILEISVGTARLGRRETYVNLSDSLHSEILEGRYTKREVAPARVRQRIGQTFGQRPRFVSVYASAFGGGILFSNKWGVEAKMGHEEIGYHFWSTGSFRALAVFDQLKLGILAPLGYGLVQTHRMQPLEIRPRRLTGATGFSAEFELPISDATIKSHLTVGDITRISDYSMLTDSTETYFVHTVAQLSYSRQLFVGTSDHVLTLTGGFGTHQIGFGTVQPDLHVTTTNKENFVSPLIRVEYMNQNSNMYGVSMQYYSSIVHVKGWVELIKNFIYLDMQYYTPFLRDPKPWEQSYFFMISPRIQVIY